MKVQSVKNNRIAKNTLFLYIRMFVVLIITLYTSRVILRVLGVEDYGIYNLVAGFVSMFAFLNNSLATCIQRFYNYELGKQGEEGFQKVFTTSIVIQILLTFVVVVLVETIGLWFLENKLVIPDERLDSARFLFQMSVLSMAAVILQAPFSSAIMAYERMDYYAVVGIIDIILKLLIVIILPYINCDSLMTYGILLVCVAFTNVLLYVIYTLIYLPTITVKFRFHKALFSEMVLFSGWSIFGSFIQVVRNQGLNILLNMFFGPAVNAARGLSFQVKGGLISFISNISTASNPQIVESYAKGDTRRSIKLMMMISKICFILLYLMVLPVASEIDFLLLLWLGDGIPEYTSIFTVLILIISLIDCFNGPTTTIIYANGSIKWYNILTGFVGLCVIPLSYVILKSCNNPIWVYVVSIVISLLVLLVSILCLKRIVSIPVRDYFKFVLWPSCLLVFVTWWLPCVLKAVIDTGWGRFFACVCLSSCFVAIVAYLLCLSTTEKLYIKNILQTIYCKIRATFSR